jgi:hypothetical protein
VFIPAYLCSSVLKIFLSMQPMAGGGASSDPELFVPKPV